MLERFTILLLLAIAIDVSLLIAAILLLLRKQGRVKTWCLLAYALTAVYSDYTPAAVKIDRMLERGGKLWKQITLPADVNYFLNVAGRCALLAAILLFLVKVLKRESENSGAGNP